MTNLSAISPHAVMRYLERVMNLAVTADCWTMHDDGQRMNAALMACRAHGLPRSWPDRRSGANADDR